MHSAWARARLFRGGVTAWHGRLHERREESAGARCTAPGVPIAPVEAARYLRLSFCSQSCKRTPQESMRV